jgi:hypothetical protein
MGASVPPPPSSIFEGADSHELRQMTPPWRSVCSAKYQGARGLLLVRSPLGFCVSAFREICWRYSDLDHRTDRWAFTQCAISGLGVQIDDALAEKIEM